jgi:hypothetical protein
MVTFGQTFAGTLLFTGLLMLYAVFCSVVLGDMAIYFSLILLGLTFIIELRKKRRIETPGGRFKRLLTSPLLFIRHNSGLKVAIFMTAYLVSVGVMIYLIEEYIASHGYYGILFS